MCEQCSAATLTYGEPLPGIALIQATRDGLSMKKGQWGLVVMNDPFIIFNSAPVPNPRHGMTDDELDALEDYDPCAEAWFDLAGEFRNTLLVEPRMGATLISKAEKEGFTDDEGDFAYWLFHRMGEVVKANPNPVNDNPEH